MDRIVYIFIMITYIQCDVEFANQNTKIRVIEPIPLQNIFRNGVIDFTISSFGNIPYDKSIQGHMVKASPLDGCTTLSNQTKTAPIIFMQRGGCTFTQKAMNAQLIGAKIVIVMDNKIEDENDIQLISDNHAAEVDVPMIMINQLDGISFSKYLDSTNDQDSVVIHISFPRLRHMDMTSVDVWTSSDSYNSILMTEDIFNTIQKEFINDQNLSLSIGYAYHYCVYCAKTNYQSSSINCICGGRYCSNYDYESGVDGEQIVFENIRQKCIYNHYLDDYAVYLQTYRQLCFNSITQVLNPNLSECTSNIRNRMGLHKADECFEDSFTNFNDKLGVGDNTIAKDDRDRLTKINLHSYPVVFINDLQYKGKLHGANVLQSICNSFNIDRMPQHCQQIIHSKDNYDRIVDIVAEKNSQTKTIMFYLVSLIIALGIVLIFYRRHLKREMKSEMQVQVNSAISQYYALNDPKQSQEFQ